jgi:hypothetical protein
MHTETRNENGARPALGGDRKRFTSIPGFSDQPGLPRLGKLRLGIRERKGDKEHPRETDHFVLDVAESVPPAMAKEIAEKFVERYGNRPQVIDNMVFLSERAESFSQSYEWWRAGKLGCSGNGDEAIRSVTVSSGDGTAVERRPWQPCANSGDCPEWNSGKQCHFIARLRFMLPEISAAGYWQIDTGSIHGARNINACLNLLETLTTQIEGKPRIHSIPLILTRVPEKIEFAGKLNEHYILHLTPENITFDQLKQLAASQPKALLNAAPLEVVEPEGDMPEEQVPESEQLETPAFDPEKEKRIVAGFAMLRINVGTQAAMRSQLPLQDDLIAELDRLWKELPSDEKKRRKAAGVAA